MYEVTKNFGVIPLGFVEDLVAEGAPFPASAVRDLLRAARLVEPLSPSDSACFAGKGDQHPRATASSRAYFHSTYGRVLNRLKNYGIFTSSSSRPTYILCMEVLGKKMEKGLSLRTKISQVLVHFRSRREWKKKLDRPTSFQTTVVKHTAQGHFLAVNHHHLAPALEAPVAPVRRRRLPNHFLRTQVQALACTGQVGRCIRAVTAPEVGYYQKPTNHSVRHF
jgi:hypothetical protein